MSDFTREEIARLARIRQRIKEKASQLPEPQKPEEQGVFFDTVDAVQHGLLSGVADIADGIGFFTGSETAKNAAKSVRGVAKDQINQMSETGRKAFQGFGVEKGGDGTFDYKLKDDSSLLGFGLNFASGLGSFAPSMIPGMAASKALSTAAKVGAGVTKGTTAAKVVDKVADTTAYAGTGAIAIGGATGNNARETIQNADLMVLKDAPIFRQKYWQLRDDNVDHETALDMAQAGTAEELAKAAAADGGVLGALSQGLLGPVLGKLVRGEGGTIGKATAKGVATEGAQEFIESGGQKAISNVNVNPAVPTGTMDGVIEDALTGAIIGGPVGGVVGAGGAAIGGNKTNSDRPTTTPQPTSDLQSPIGQLEAQIDEIEAQMQSGMDTMTDAEYEQAAQIRAKLLADLGRLTGNEPINASGPQQQSESEPSNIGKEGELIPATNTQTNPVNEGTLLDGQYTVESGTEPQTQYQLNAPQGKPVTTPQFDVIYGEPPQPTQEQIAAKERTRAALEDPVTEPKQSRRSQDPAYQEQLRLKQEQEAKNAKFEQNVKDRIYARKAEIEQQQQQEKQALESDKPVTKVATGARTRAYTPSNEPIDVEYHIVEANELVTSNDDNLKPNPSYPQALQNRDRQTEHSRQQIQSIADKLIPEKLAQSADVSTGAPIVRNGIVESGNGRTLAIRKAYTEGKGEGYRQYLIENANQFGVDEQDIGKFKNPVLVRQRLTEMAPEQLKSYTKDANTTESQALKPSEQAKSDAARLKTADLELLDVTENGDIRTPGNSGFVQQFFGLLSPNEQSGIMAKDGTLSKAGATRIQNAIFAKAYNSESLIDEATDAVTPESANIMNALVMAAPSFAKLNSNNEKQEITGAIVDAVEMVKKAKREGTTVRELTQQAQIEGIERAQGADTLANFFDGNIRSSKRIAEALVTLAKQTEQAIYNSQTDGLFGPEPMPNAQELINANRQINTDSTTGQQPATQTQRPQTQASIDQDSGGSKPQQQTQGRTAASRAGRVETADRAGQPEQQEVKLSRGGKAFSSEKVARLSQTFKATPNAEVVPVNGGYGVIEGESRTLDGEGRAKDGKPINAGDTFTTLSGQTTTPYPIQKGEKYASQWLIDNATQEAELRGDSFNASQFKATSPLKTGELTQADKDSMLMYLFESQPQVPRSFARPLISDTTDQQGAMNKPIAAELPDTGLTFEGKLYPEVKHTTKKGKELSGIVVEGITREDAEATDPYTFKKDNGFFIRSTALKNKPTLSAQNNINEQSETTINNDGIVDFSKAKTVREKAEKWKAIKGGDTINNHHGNRIGTVLDAPVKHRPRTIKIRKIDGSLENFNLTQVTGEGSQIVGIVDGLFNEGDTTAKTNSDPIQAPKEKPVDQPKADAKTNIGKLDKAEIKLSALKKEKAEKVKALLKKKMGQLNSGIDPEVMLAIAELGGVTIAEGAVKFAKWARDIVQTMRAIGVEDGSVTPFLKEAYGAISANPEKYGISDDIADQMDTPRDIRKQNLDDIISKMDSEQGSLSDFLGTRLDDITDNNKLKAVIAEYDNVSTKDIGNERLKDGQESLEKALVIRARQIVEEGKEDKATFDELVSLYKNQPNLDVRSSTSMENQAYSTPAPLAFVVSRLAGIDQSTTVYEPTAGNGMLLIGANKDNATLNELNDLRADQLQEQGFKVTRYDAVEYVPSKKVDSVIMNPPFAKIDRTTYDGYVLKALDHVIVAKALEAMKDDGKASIIIGASRNDGEIKPADRTFFNWLYSTYNVTDHFEVSGDLYSRQGASWPVRVITVSGRIQSDTLSPKSGTIERVTTWDQVYDRFMESLETSQRQSEQAKRSNVDSNDRTQDDQASAGSPRVKATQPNKTVEGRERGGSGARRATSDTGLRGDDATRGNAQSGSVSSGAGKSKPDADGGRRPDAKGGTGSQRQSETEPNDAAGVGRGRADSDQRVSKETKSEPKAKDQKDTTDASEYQKEYETFSGGSNEAVLTPENMAEASSRSLQKIADSVGGIDQYVMEKLGYDNLDQLHNSFMGLQVDTVAAAIYNAENKGRGIIIADQTGVGKGRQAAGIIRYALKEGKVPVFITVKDNLFTDMYNDLKDIGSNDVSPLIMNIDAGITENGNKIFKNKPKDHRKILENIAKTGELPKGSNALFLTYSQINKENTQRQVIDALKDKAFFVLDESHNAAGNRSTVVKGAEKLSTAGFIYQAIENAPVTYLSATYAKRPDNLPVYYRTDIVDAVDNIDELSDAIQAGGETLQTIIAGMLAESGQLYRRERSFKGIEINTKIDKKNSAKHTEVADNITIGIRAIVDADRLFHEIGVKAISESLAAQGASASGAGNKASSSVNHTNFTSIVHNFISQMLLGLKVERTVEEAIAAHKRGEKPVIALQNTMGSFLTEYVTENNLREGDPIDANYKDVLQRALDRTRRITIKNKMGQDDTVTVELKDLDPVVRYAYKEAQDVIDGLDIESMPISPIDYVREKLERAGIRTSEITGRKNTIDYSGRVPRVGKRDAKEAADKRSVVDGFNKGDIDALVVNVAGATGLSIHSSAKFNDTKPRHMIIMQAMGDINIFMQMIGRINRTGQVNLPIYTNLGLDIPAEKRPLAKTSRKMKSLNANTSANTESDTSLDVADILNKYGDQVVSDYLKENPSVAVETGLSVEAMAWGLAEKFTGRMALLPVKRQTEIYAEIEAEYADLIDYLNKVGQNDLVPTKLDMQAKVEETIVIYEGKDPSSTFGGNTYLHKVDAKYQGKPPTAREVSDALDKAPDGDEIIAQITQNKEADDYLNKFDQESENAYSENEEHIAKVLKELGYSSSTSVGEAIDKAEAAGDRAAVKKLKAALKKSFSTSEKYSDIKRNELIDLIKKNKLMLQRFKIGNHVLLEVDGEAALAVVTNVRDSHKSGNGNPWSLSKTKISFMLDSGIRQIDLPLSKLGLDDGIYIESKKTKGKEQLEALFDKAELIENRRERRFVATGNLIKGSAELSGKGRIVSFTMANGDVAQGILLTRKFKDAEFTGMKKNAIFAVREPKKISQMLRSDAKISVFTSDKSIKVEKEGMRWAVIVPKANKTSEVKAVKFDKELRKIIGSDFYGKGQEMKALVDESKLDATIGRLSDIVTLNADPQSRAAWVRAGGREAPKVDNILLSADLNLSSSDNTGGMKADELRKSLQPMIDELGEQTTFEVLQSIDDLPFAIRIQAKVKLNKARENNPDKTSVMRGVNVGNKSYLIAEHIKNEKEAVQIFLHEVVGHKAVLNMLGKDGDAIMERIALSYGAKALADLSKTYGVDLKTKAGRVLLGKEKVARMAELNEKPSLLGKLVANVKQFLRQYFPNLPWSDSDVLSLISNARQRAGKINMVKIDLDAEPSKNANADEVNLSVSNNNPDDINKIVNEINATPKSQQSLLKRATEYVKSLKDTDLTSIKQGLIDSYASIESLEKQVNFGALMDGAESAYKAALRTANLDSVMEVAMRKGALEYKDGAFQVKEGTKGLMEIFQGIADSDQLQLWETWAGAKRARRIMMEDAKANEAGQDAIIQNRKIISMLRKTAPAKYKGGLSQWQKDMKEATRAIDIAKKQAFQKRERLYTAAKIAKIIKFVDSKPELKQQFEEAQKEWRKFNKAMLDMATDAGLIDPESRMIWESDDYVPFHRVSEVEDDGIKNPFMRKRGLSGQKSGIEQLKGGVEKLNIIESMVRGTTHLVDASFKNVAMQRIVNIADGVAMEKLPTTKMEMEEVKQKLVELGYEPETMDDDLLNAWANQIARYDNIGKGVISVSKNGKPLKYQVTDTGLYTAITQLGPMRIEGIMKIFQMPKRLLTTLVTSDPGFMAANFMRDTLSTWVTVDAKTTPVYDAMKGAAKGLRRSDTQWAMMAAGAGGGGYYDTAPDNVRQHLSTLRKGGAVHTPKRMWDAWMRVGQSLENANRIAVFDAVIKEGGTVAEAAHEAQDVINFSKRGAYPAVQALITMVPFLNARIQGLDRLYRGAKDSPKSFMVKGMILMAGSLAILASNWDNEEYWALDEWDRDANWHIWVNGEHFKIPKPFEVGAVFGTIPERAFEQLRGDADSKLLGERLLAMITGTFAMDPTPQLFKPAVDVAKNENGFTKNPILSFGDQYRTPEGQYSPWTSETMKQLAEAMPDNAPEWARSPKRLEYLLRGYFGTLGGYALGVTDMITREIVDAPDMPEATPGKIPVIKRFYSDEITGNKHVGRFYDMLDETSKLNAEINALVKEGKRQKADELKLSNMKKLQIRSSLNKVSSQLSDISAQIKTIHQSTTMGSSEKRRRIDELTKRRNEIASSASLRYYGLF